MKCSKKSSNVSTSGEGRQIRVVDNISRPTPRITQGTPLASHHDEGDGGDALHGLGRAQGSPDPWSHL
jgi:hypothetical protein